ncbi:cryptochrome/photolyase family protein [Aliarcobacter skirrowii]|nr:cryptochrome/photolyase family protein [Aliarcobacter skirrowii]MDX4070272.1 cryptochrome/photolyase family protein [Aliarcobacter skirrowii]
MNFINPNDKNKFLHKFYKNRRKELNIFMQNGKPLFDKYSFDEDN